jgi:hypothetical protein
MIKVKYLVIKAYGSVKVHRNKRCQIGWMTPRRCNGTNGNGKEEEEVV